MIRINQYVAKSTGISRRKADELVESKRVRINGSVATIGQQVRENDSVTLDGHEIHERNIKTVVFNKPVGFVSSRVGQGGNKTIYDLLPEDFSNLNPVGRLDKDSSGLMILSNDGESVNRLSHPSSGKWKRYYIETNPKLTNEMLSSLNQGVKLEDGESILKIDPRGNGYTVLMQEGRNRQIRRTVEKVGAAVTKLHREAIGEIEIGTLREGEFKEMSEVAA